MRTYRQLYRHPAGPGRPSVEGEAKSVLGSGGPAVLAVQPQLVMDSHQRIRLRSLLMIGHNELCAPRPINRMPPLQKPSVSAPIRRRPPLPHRSSSGPGLGGAGSGDTFDEVAALRACLDPGQRLQRPYRARACSGLQERQLRWRKSIDRGDGAYLPFRPCHGGQFVCVAV